MVFGGSYRRGASHFKAGISRLGSQVALRAAAGNSTCWSLYLTPFTGCLIDSRSPRVLVLVVDQPLAQKLCCNFGVKRIMSRCVWL